MNAYTLIHVLISLVGMAAGFVAVYGFITERLFDRWNAVFLAATTATSLTGFGFPFERLLPSHIVGAISLAVLSFAFYARYRRHLAGGWRAGYVIGSVLALYLNVFVFVVQAFLKTPYLKQLAPTQSEPPFKVTQGIVFAALVALGTLSVRGFRLAPVLLAARLQPVVTESQQKNQSGHE